MATPSLVYQDSPGGLPATFTLPPGFDLELAQVHATFDGAGASGTFYPCFAIYSQDNKLLGRYFPSQTLAAGDDGGVTFAPFLGGAASSVVTGGGAPVGPYSEWEVDGGFQTIPTGTNTNLVLAQTFSLPPPDTSLWEAAGDIINSNGDYDPWPTWDLPDTIGLAPFARWLITAEVQWADPSVSCVLQIGGGVAFDYLVYDGVASLAGIALGLSSAYTATPSYFGPSVFCQVRQNTGADLDVTYARVTAGVIGYQAA